MLLQTKNSLDTYVAFKSSRQEDFASYLKLQYNNHSLCDVKINIYSTSPSSSSLIDTKESPPVKCYYLHRVIVSQALMFKKMLDNDSNWLESKQKQVNLNCFDGQFITEEVLDLFFKLFYRVDDNAILEFNDEIQTHCIALHHLANMVEYDSLKKEIENIICKHMIDKKNIIQLIFYCSSDPDSTVNIRKYCIQWLKCFMYPHSMVRDKLLTSMGYEMFYQIVSSNDLFTIDNNRSITIEQYLSLPECFSKCSPDQVNDLKTLAIKYSMIKSVTHRRIDDITSLRSVVSKCTLHAIDMKNKDQQIPSSARIRNHDKSSSSSSSSSSEIELDGTSRKRRKRKRILKSGGDDGGHHPTMQNITDLDKPFYARLVPAIIDNNNNNNNNIEPPLACNHKATCIAYISNDDQYDNSKPKRVHKFELLDCLWELFITRGQEGNVNNNNNSSNNNNNNVTLSLSVEDNKETATATPPSSRRKAKSSVDDNHNIGARYKSTTKMIECECDIEIIILGRTDSLTFTKQILQTTADGCRRDLCTIQKNFDENHYFMQECKENDEEEVVDSNSIAVEQQPLTKIAIVPIILNIRVKSLKTVSTFKRVQKREDTPPLPRKNNNKLVMTSINMNPKQSIVLIPPSSPRVTSNSQQKNQSYINIW